jgi:hypothetical protein
MLLARSIEHCIYNNNRTEQEQGNSQLQLQCRPSCKLGPSSGNLQAATSSYKRRGTVGEATPAFAYAQSPLPLSMRPLSLSLVLVRLFARFTGWLRHNHNAEL